MNKGVNMYPGLTFGPTDYKSHIENLVSFERTTFEDFSIKFRTKIFGLFMSISIF